MKLFLDTADVDSIKRAHDTGLLDGVTTNPSHIAKTGRFYQEVVKEICAITPGPVSVEAVGDSAAELIDSARQMNELAKNVVVKIPMTIEGLKAVPVLEKEHDIRTNVTMVFSSTQSLMAMKAGATFVSIVLSRLDAVANESDVLVQDAVIIKDNYGFDSEVLAGSLKTQNQMLACLRFGVDIATIPEMLFFQLYNHPLTEMGIAQFNEDWKTVPKA